MRFGSTAKVLLKCKLNQVFTLERLKVAEAFCVDLALLKVNRALS